MCMDQQFVNGPFNYLGNKYKQLPQLFSFFPESAVFVDLFCGGGSVGINSNSKKVIFNDSSKQLMALYRYFKTHDVKDIIEQIEQLIKHYRLSNTAKYGYRYYGANSSKGLADINRAGFYKLRSDYNKTRDSLLLYLLIIFAFNNEIRFDKTGNYNLPVGKRDFNKSMQNKLIAFVAHLHQLNCSFSSKNFTDVDVPDNAFVYCDPPYTITTACYGNQHWNEQNDQELFAYLDKLNQRGIRFALSDVLEHKGVINQELEQWRQSYVTHSIEYDYNNSNYHSRAKQHKTREILITNY